MLNLNKSYSLYKENKEHLIKGDCYNNTPKVLAKNFLEEFKTGKAKLAIVYCGTDDYLIRHCVIIIDNEIIDIGLFFGKSFKEVQEFISENNPKYYILKEFFAKEYLEALIESYSYGSLQEHMKSYDLKFAKECYENNRQINPTDYDNFISPLFEEI